MQTPVTVVLLTAMAAMLTPAATTASQSQPLPRAVYKAECPLPTSNGPLYLGQGIPTVYLHGHIDVVRDIQWLSVGGERSLIGYAITGMSGEIVLVPYTTRHVFTQWSKVLAANMYVPLGNFKLSEQTLNAALQKKHLLSRPSERITLHQCFSNKWDGSYPKKG